MRFLMAGESHGNSLIAILEGFPKGVKIEESFINCELKRRKQGYGRGKRMIMEEDKVEIVSGLRNKITLGSPIAVFVKNKDYTIFTQKKDDLPLISIPRPAHADLAGSLKYKEKDIRNILEKSSARETVMRVCIGAICKQFLSYFKIRIASFVVGIGKVYSKLRPHCLDEILKKTAKSKISSFDHIKEPLMLKEIDNAEKTSDTLGGFVEVWAEGVPVGLGSFMHFDKRLDAQIAGYMMSIPSVKTVEIGSGFDYVKSRGSVSHDRIYPKKTSYGFLRKTNNCGGIEGGVSNGQPIIVRVGAKPIPTLKNPLDSVDLVTNKKKKAPVIRSDVCIVGSLGVICESMLAIVLTENFLEKFGRDSLKEIKRNYTYYIKSIL
mgnify:CR=1 FL=1